MTRPFDILLQDYIAGILSEKELELFFELLPLEQNRRLLEMAIDERAADQTFIFPENSEWHSRMLLRMERSIHAQNKPAAHRIHFLKTAWFRWAAAIIILCGIGTYIFTLTSQPDKEVATIQPSPKSNDVMPGSEKAILTLSNGSRVELSKATSEIIADGNLTIENSNGQLSYKNADVVAMNTMTTPKGGQYQLTLADGTRVWLNAASSITYPTAFKGAAREVSVTGEAYFEVVTDKSKPFVVLVGDEKIEVLGTSFNVNSYPDEVSKTSLISGAIKIKGNILKPGQGYQNGSVVTTDVQQDIAWKNGAFNFHRKKIKEVMNELTRWYDIEAKYEGPVPQTQFYGEMGRDLKLSQILKLLEESGVKFSVEGKTIIIRK